MPRSHKQEGLLLLLLSETREEMVTLIVSCDVLARYHSIGGVAN
jgi:hypothetical protein